MTPCAPEPEGVAMKSVGLMPCPDCRSTECWLHYLCWEVSAGVTLNAAQHHRVRRTVVDQPGALRVRMRDDQTVSGSGNNFASVAVIAEHAERAAFARQALAVKMRELEHVCDERDRLSDAVRRITQECRDIAAYCERHDADLDAAIRGNLRRA